MQNTHVRSDRRRQWPDVVQASFDNIRIPNYGVWLFGDNLVSLQKLGLLHSAVLSCGCTPPGCSGLHNRWRVLGICVVRKLLRKCVHLLALRVRRRLGNANKVGRSTASRISFLVKRRTRQQTLRAHRSLKARATL